MAHEDRQISFQCDGINFIAPVKKTSTVKIKDGKKITTTLILTPDGRWMLAATSIEEVIERDIAA